MNGLATQSLNGENRGEVQEEDNTRMEVGRNGNPKYRLNGRYFLANGKILTISGVGRIMG